MFFFRSLAQVISKYPKTSEIISAFILTSQADLICQFIENKFHKKEYQKSYDLQRSLNLALFRSTAVTPVLHYWYKWLSEKIPGRDLRSIFIRSLVDRLTLGPVIMAGFFAAHCYSTGGGLQEFENRMRSDFVKTNKVSIFYWTSLLVLTFRFVPVGYQVLTIDLIGFGWMIYLSFNMNKRVIRT
jgi:hypothetical protein